MASQSAFLFSLLRAKYMRNKQGRVYSFQMVQEDAALHGLGLGVGGDRRR